MLFRRFESLIDVFKPSPDVAPPTGMLRFYSHYLKQVWPLMLAVLIIGFFAALIEVALFSFLGQLIDMARPARMPAASSASTRTSCCGCCWWR